MTPRTFIVALLAALIAVPALALEPAKFRKRATPGYPKDAAEKNVQGCATISFVVGADGLSDKYQMVHSEPPGLFDKAALLALNDSKFEPGDGKTRYYATFRFFPDEAARSETRCDVGADK